MSSWGYKDDNGPARWKDLGFPIAAEGKRQSPIDICPTKAEEDKNLTEAPLKWKYPSNCCTDIENTGASWKVNTNGDKTSLRGGPMGGDKFKLWQFHAHWGKENERGSEHTVDGKMYPGEIHFVHWNTKYENPGEAVSKPDGLCVLGRFFELGDESDDELDRVVRMLARIELKGQKVPFLDERDPEDPELPGSPPDVAGMLPEAGAKYFTYLGSLTTPPLAESVIWVVFNKPLIVTERQLDAMRSLVVEDSCDCEDRIVDNYRPPQPTGDRKIRSCN